MKLALWHTPALALAAAALNLATTTQLRIERWDRDPATAAFIGSATWRSECGSSCDCCVFIIEACEHYKPAWANSICRPKLKGAEQSWFSRCSTCSKCHLIRSPRHMCASSAVVHVACCICADMCICKRFLCFFESLCVCVCEFTECTARPRLPAKKAKLATGRQAIIYISIYTVTNRHYCLSTFFSTHTHSQISRLTPKSMIDRKNS